MMERFRAFFTKVITPVARLLIRLGVSPDAVTLVGTLGVCAGALVFFPQGKLLTGCLVIAAFVFSDRLDAILVLTAFSAILDLPVLLYIALWALAIASTVTVGQRVWVVRRQALAEAALPSPHE